MRGQSCLDGGGGGGRGRYSGITAGFDQLDNDRSLPPLISCSRVPSA